MLADSQVNSVWPSLCSRRGDYQGQLGCKQEHRAMHCAWCRSANLCLAEISAGDTGICALLLKKNLTFMLYIADDFFLR